MCMCVCLHVQTEQFLLTCSYATTHSVKRQLLHTEPLSLLIDHMSDKEITRYLPNADSPVCKAAHGVIIRVCAASKQIKTVYRVGLHVEVLSGLPLFLSFTHVSIQNNKVYGVQRWQQLLSHH